MNNIDPNWMSPAEAGAVLLAALNLGDISEPSRCEAMQKFAGCIGRASLKPFSLSPSDLKLSASVEQGGTGRQVDMDKLGIHGRPAAVRAHLTWACAQILMRESTDANHLAAINRANRLTEPPGPAELDDQPLRQAMARMALGSFKPQGSADTLMHWQLRALPEGGAIRGAHLLHGDERFIIAVQPDCATAYSSNGLLWRGKASEGTLLAFQMLWRQAERAKKLQRETEQVAEELLRRD